MKKQLIVILFGLLILLNAAASVHPALISAIAESRKRVGSAGTAFYVSGTLSSTRNNYTGSVGVAVVIGASDVVITHLGRWIVSGNSQSHTLRIFSNKLSPVLEASVSVNTSGAPAGQFVYGELSSPFTALASTEYFFMSDEVNTQDAWYDSMSFTHTDVGTVSNAAYRGGASGGTGTINYTAGTDKIYVPVDFKYSYP